MSKAIYIEDNLFDKTIIDNERYTVRVIIKNKDNLFGYIYVNGEDIFGYRDHIESSGGGIEEGETDEAPQTEDADEAPENEVATEE